MGKSDMIYAFYLWPLFIIGMFAVSGLLYELILWVMSGDKNEEL